MTCSRCRSLWFCLASILFAAFAPLTAAEMPPEWRFESSGGVPSMLVWQTEEWASYDLWYSADLDAWSHVDGFPRKGTGGAMEHPVEPGGKGFFRIVVEAIEPPVPADFVAIPGGEFWMGDSRGQLSNAKGHWVDVSPFHMAKYEVTKVHWDEVANWAAAHGYDIGPGSASGKAADHPVSSVSWYECVKWCNARSEKEGLTACYTVEGAVYRTGSFEPDCDFAANGYRLPTEAEWEKAARGGLSDERYPWGDEITHELANYWSLEWEAHLHGDVSETRGSHPDYDEGGYPHTSPVGSFPPNAYGLHDMAGNLMEWCHDWYGYYLSLPTEDPRGPGTGSYRILRGGSWYHGASVANAARRHWEAPEVKGMTEGFRPVRR